MFNIIHTHTLGNKKNGNKKSSISSRIGAKFLKLRNPDTRLACSPKTDHGGALARHAEQIRKTCQYSAQRTNFPKFLIYERSGQQKNKKFDYLVRTNIFLLPRGGV